MKLLTKEIRKKLPLIGTHRNTPDDQIPIVVKWAWASSGTCTSASTPSPRHVPSSCSLMATQTATLNTHLEKS